MECNKVAQNINGKHCGEEMSAFTQLENEKLAQQNIVIAFVSTMKDKMGVLEFHGAICDKFKVNTYDECVCVDCKIAILRCKLEGLLVAAYHVGEELEYNGIDIIISRNGPWEILPSGDYVPFETYDYNTDRFNPFCIGAVFQLPNK